MERVDSWLAEHRAKADRAYLALEEGTAALVVVRKGQGFDPDFAQGLARLDLDILRDEALDAIGFRSIDLPLCSNGAAAPFIDLSQAWAWSA